MTTRDLPGAVVPTGVVGYEYRWYPSTNLIAQLYASRSVYGFQVGLGFEF